MEKQEILKILYHYGIYSVLEYREIDTTKGEDYRLNIIIDKKYVLRINNPVINEDRLQSISGLGERYKQIGVLTPMLIKNRNGTYITNYGNYICYLSEYLDYKTANEIDGYEYRLIKKEILKAIGVFAANYTDIDLSPVNSMWSLIDLAPLDVDMDEKQENINELVAALNKFGETDLAQKVISYNNDKRERIKAVYKKLPRCVIQGDLNESNILVEDGHFVGLIDFNLSGTEVNVNQFCCETNGSISEADFVSKEANVIYDEWIVRQNNELDIILSEYILNELEKAIIEEYRSICLISQYPNVMDFLYYMKIDKEKTLQIIRMILNR